MKPPEPYAYILLLKGNAEVSVKIGQDPPKVWNLSQYDHIDIPYPKAV